MDVPRIVQMLMFHEAARGRSYTGLTHRYQPYDRPVGARPAGPGGAGGPGAKPVAQLAASGEQPLAEPRRIRTTWTWYRLVLPVQPTNVCLTVQP